jgi:dipeptidyl aminopeptidase/acylaminoacyl peptidase
MNDPSSSTPTSAPVDTPGSATTDQPSAQPRGETASTSASAVRRPVSKEDLLRLVWIADPQISPDGSRVAFTRVSVDVENDRYQTSVWLAEPGRDARPLTSGIADAQPRWSPDGTRIAFVRSPAPKEPGQLHVLIMSGGEAQRVCELPKGASEPVWSPDGHHIAFLSKTNPALDDPKREKPKNEPGRVVTRPVFRENDIGFHDFDHLAQVWVVDAAGGTPRALTRGAFPARSLAWSRDGKHVLFLSDRRAEPWFGSDSSVLYAVSPELAEPTEGAALETVANIGGYINAYQEHADGRIAIVGYQTADPPLSYYLPRLYLTEGAWPRTSVRDLSKGCDDEVGGAIASDQHPPRGGGALPFAFSSDGREVRVMLARHGASALASFPIAGGAPRTLTPAGRDLIAGTASADGRYWALTIGDPTRPGDLYRLDTATGELRAMHAPNEALFAELSLGEVEEFWYASFDGRKVQGWIVKPPGFDPKQKYPMLLEIHGGPHGAYGVGFFHEFHHLAGAGYVVLYTNPRGSTTYGHEFAQVIQYRFPGDDAKDLLSAVDEVVKRGYVDTKRLGVTGGSGGGLLTNWIVTQTDRFAAAATQRCVSDWASFYYSADFSMFTPFWFQKAPWEDPAEYAERSPVALAAKITTPLMIVHSEEDWRCPIGQGEAMFRALKQQRKIAVMVRFPGESHELSRSGTPSRRVQNQLHLCAWFDHWLMGKPAPEYGV